MIRVGLVDFDTSHVVAFTQRLNHLGIDPSDWVEGAKVVAGWPGDSAIMPERIKGYAEQLSSCGIELVSRPEELYGKIDAVMIESQQGSRHLERARPFLERGMPTFVDKPFANSLRDADEMIALARRHRAPLMTASALRYDPRVQEALAKRAQLGRILSADVWTSAALHPGNPGLLHYGIHGVEMLYTLLGAGCRRVQNSFTEQGEVVSGLWAGGHTGTVRGLREGAGGFGMAVHYEKGHFTAQVEGAAFYRELLKAVVAMFQTGRPPIDLDESREVIAFILAAKSSADRRGAGIDVPRPRS